MFVPAFSKADCLVFTQLGDLAPRDSAREEEKHAVADMWSSMRGGHAGPRLGVKQESGGWDASTASAFEEVVQHVMKYMGSKMKDDDHETQISFIVEPPSDGTWDANSDAFNNFPWRDRNGMEAHVKEHKLYLPSLESIDSKRCFVYAEFGGSRMIAIFRGFSGIVAAVLSEFGAHPQDMRDKLKNMLVPRDCQIYAEKEVFSALSHASTISKYVMSKGSVVYDFMPTFLDKSFPRIIDPKFRAECTKRGYEVHYSPSKFEMIMLLPLSGRLDVMIAMLKWRDELRIYGFRRPEKGYDQALFSILEMFVETEIKMADSDDRYEQRVNADREENRKRAIMSKDVGDPVQWKHFGTYPHDIEDCMEKTDLFRKYLLGEVGDKYSFVPVYDEIYHIDMVKVLSLKRTALDGYFKHHGYTVYSDGEKKPKDKKYPIRTWQFEIYRGDDNRYNRILLEFKRFDDGSGDKRLLVCFKKTD